MFSRQHTSLVDTPTNPNKCRVLISHICHDVAYQRVSPERLDACCVLGRLRGVSFLLGSAGAGTHLGFHSG